MIRILNNTQSKRRQEMRDQNTQRTVEIKTTNSKISDSKRDNKKRQQNKCLFLASERKL